MTYLFLASTILMLASMGNISDVICGMFMLLGLGIVIASFIFWIVGQSRRSNESELKGQVALLAQQVRDLERRVKQLADRDHTQPAAQPAATPAAPSSVTPRDTALKPALPSPVLPELPAFKPPVQPTPSVQSERRVPPVQPAAPERAGLPASPSQPVKTSVEERLGTGVFIWVGGICLILAGAFFVKYSFDNNLISPLVRLILGTVFGFALLAAAQYMHKKSRKIASSLAGAGVADLFACLLAANSIYHLINTPTAFVLMIVVTGMAILLSLRHGRLVAILGLVGGFVTPAIIGSGSQQIGPLLAYLMLLQVAMTLVSRRRAWVGMTTLTMAGGLVWAMVLMFGGLGYQHRFMLELFLIGSAVLYILSASRLAAGEREAKQNSPLDSLKIALGSVSAAVVLIGVLVYQGRFGVMDLSMLGLLGAALLVLARLRPNYGPMAWLAGGVSLCTLIAWSLHTARWDQQQLGSTFAIVALAYGLLYMLGSYIAMWRSRNERSWAGGCAAAGLAFFLVAKCALHGEMPQSELELLPGLSPRYDWTAIAGILGLVYALLAYPVWRTRLLYLQGNNALGAMVSASALLFALTAQFGLDYPWQLPVVAGLAAAMAFLIRWQRIIRIQVVALAFGVIVTCVLIVPGAAAMEYSQRLIINAILPAYALTAIALGLAAWFLRAKRDAKAGSLLRLMAIIIAAVGTLALFRHGYHPIQLHKGDVTLYEWATYSVVAFSLAHGLLLWHRYSPGWPQQSMAAVLLALGVMDVFVGAGVIANPLWHSYSVGSWPVLNGLLFIYGVPAVLIALLFFNRPHTNDTTVQKALPGVWGFMIFVLLFALVSLQVRQYFHHPMLNTNGVSNAEMYSYSVAWIILGIVLVAIGIRFKSRSMRYASLVVMLIAIGKVFLLDTAHLQDLYRVISFLGLGITLMVLGYVYQKFVFKKTAVEV